MSRRYKEIRVIARRGEETGVRLNRYRDDGGRINDWPGVDERMQTRGTRLANGNEALREIGRRTI